ncbi:MAG: methyl-accepting chemotaxis protein [Novosphingopyxis baekryungensis]|jgi:methyl-accepting chemotaxis protein|nr:methyl-accepting chemotaxis protein [Novosphingopyxis baekryungensis]
MSELALLRKRGLAILAVMSWISTAWLLFMGWQLQSDNLGIVLFLAIGVNIGPTLMALTGQHRTAARLISSTLAVMHPALGVYLLMGHGWMIDAHMYFFVALAALTVLCDWRPIALASVMIAVHHLLLDFYVPEWVFAGSGSFARVMVHVVAVVLQFSVLGYVTERLRRLTVRQAQSKAHSDELAQQAVDRQGELQMAMEELRAAQQRELDERARRLRLEQDSEQQRQTERAELADRFRESISAVVDMVDRSAQDMRADALSLRTAAQQAASRSHETSSRADRASGASRDLADRMSELSTSISTIATAVEQQALLSESATDTAGTAHGTVRCMRDRAEHIQELADVIGGIASHTNLLALNATIEASRAGEAGRGFAVVAGEVKLLARQVKDATGSILGLVQSTSEGAMAADQSLCDIRNAVDELSSAAISIRTEVSRQRQTGQAIEQHAKSTADDAATVMADIAEIFSVARDTEALSDRVFDAAGSLGETARQLRAATDGFIGKLKAA